MGTSIQCVTYTNIIPNLILCVLCICNAYMHSLCAIGLCTMSTKHIHAFDVCILYMHTCGVVASIKFRLQYVYGYLARFEYCGRFGPPAILPWHLNGSTQYCPNILRATLQYCQIVGQADVKQGKARQGNKQWLLVWQGP